MYCMLYHRRHTHMLRERACTDLGYWDTQVHNPVSPTPTLGALAKEGIVLNRHYVFRYCSPTRRAFLSGRFPNHITGTQVGWWVGGLVGGSVGGWVGGSVGGSVGRWVSG
jgi:hypothetical protein